SFECRDQDFRSQCCLRKRDGNVTVEIMFASFEKLVFLNRKGHVEIAWRTALTRSLAFAAHAQLVAGINAGGYFHLERAIPDDAPFSATGLAGILDNLSRAAACGPRASNAEETLLEANLTIPVACVTGRGSASLGAATTLAVAAEFMAGKFDLL